MTWENQPTGFAESFHRRLLRRNRDSTGRNWRALLKHACHKERLRIARELHDTLLQGFLSASMQLCIVDNCLPADSPAKPVLSSALDLIRKGLKEARGALLGLRSPALPKGSLEEALAEIRDDFAPCGSSRLHIIILGQSRPLIPAVQNEVYLIAREALLNALQHSKGSRVEAEIEYLARKLRVVVRDNGSGIDPESMRTQQQSHWGLTGMQERAASIGAKVRLWSKQGEGTEVEISLPLHSGIAV